MMKMQLEIQPMLIGAAVAGLVALGAGLPVAAQSSKPAEQGTVVANGDLLIPKFDAAKGRMLFASKGCVVCHSVNGVGGTDAPNLSSSHMERPMNAFDFAAKMWLGASAMIAMQRDELGGQIHFTGDELADIIAFVHNTAEQKKFSKKDIPANILKKMEDM